MKKRINSAVCPYCGERIPLNQVREYFLKGTDHTIECRNCRRTLRPAYYPFTFERCFAFALLFTVASMYLMLFTLHFSFLKALVIFLLFACILFVMLLFGIVKTIKFK